MLHCRLATPCPTKASCLPEQIAPWLVIKRQWRAHLLTHNLRFVVCIAVQHTAGCTKALYEQQTAKQQASRGPWR